LMMTITNCSRRKRSKLRDQGLIGHEVESCACYALGP